jgi:hypothetical protein
LGGHVAGDGVRWADPTPERIHGRHQPTHRSSEQGRTTHFGSHGSDVMTSYIPRTGAVSVRPLWEPAALLAA